ncbi:splA [Symbiodinium sp. CCMP2592]|nr:splA [Symbiodinium sp. CCMP2592]
MSVLLFNVFVEALQIAAKEDRAIAQRRLFERELAAELAKWSKGGGQARLCGVMCEGWAPGGKDIIGLEKQGLEATFSHRGALPLQPALPEHAEHLEARNVKAAKPARLLFLHASPLCVLTRGPNGQSKYVHAVREALQGAVDVKVKTASVHNLRKAVTEGNLWLHLSAHTANESTLVLEDGFGGTEALTLHALGVCCSGVGAKMRAGCLLRVPVELPIGHASDTLAAAFYSAGVQHIVYTNRAVTDHCASRLAKRFYLAMACRRFLRNAFRIALSEVCRMRPDRSGNFQVGALPHQPVLPEHAEHLESKCAPLPRLKIDREDFYFPAPRLQCRRMRRIARRFLSQLWWLAMESNAVSVSHFLQTSAVTPKSDGYFMQFPRASALHIRSTASSEVSFAAEPLAPELASTWSPEAGDLNGEVDLGTVDRCDRIRSWASQPERRPSGMDRLARTLLEERHCLPGMCEKVKLTHEDALSPRINCDSTLLPIPKDTVYRDSNLLAIPKEDVSPFSTPPQRQKAPCSPPSSVVQTTCPGPWVMDSPSPQNCASQEDVSPFGTPQRQKAGGSWAEKVLAEVMSRMQAMEEKLEMTQETICRRIDFSQETVMQKLESYSGLVQNINTASDNTKRSLLDTVNTSSALMLQKLDTMQQDLLQQSQFTTRRLAEIETCLSKQAESEEMQRLRAELAAAKASAGQEAAKLRAELRADVEALAASECAKLKRELTSRRDAEELDRYRPLSTRSSIRSTAMQAAPEPAFLAKLPCRVSPPVQAAHVPAATPRASLRSTSKPRLQPSAGTMTSGSGASGPSKERLRALESEAASQSKRIRVLEVIRVSQAEVQTARASSLSGHLCKDLPVRLCKALGGHSCTVHFFSLDSAGVLSSEPLQNGDESSGYFLLSSPPSGMRLRAPFAAQVTGFGFAVSVFNACFHTRQTRTNQNVLVPTRLTRTNRNVLVPTQVLLLHALNTDVLRPTKTYFSRLQNCVFDGAVFSPRSML